MVLGTLRAAAERGVTVRLLYNVDAGRTGTDTTAAEDATGEIEALPIETRGDPGWPDLMHHKYVVRDRASVWTGSTNWTEDSWRRGEPHRRRRLQCDRAGTPQDFENSGVGSACAARARCRRRRRRRSRLVLAQARRAAGAPDRPRDRHAERRVRIASPVITSGPILGTLAEASRTARSTSQASSTTRRSTRCSLQWAANPIQTWKAPAWRPPHRRPVLGQALDAVRAGSVHDYMHAKVTVCDDTVFVGSFNLSHSGESNAENVLEIDDAALADRLAGSSTKFGRAIRQPSSGTRGNPRACATRSQGVYVRTLLAAGLALVALLVTGCGGYSSPGDGGTKSTPSSSSTTSGYAGY